DGIRYFHVTGVQTCALPIFRVVEDFARRFHCSPDRLGPRHIREYQVELFQKRKLSPNSVRLYLAALRFFYIQTLRRAWSIAETQIGRASCRDSASVVLGAEA